MSDFEFGFWVGVFTWIVVGLLMNELKLWLIKRLVNKIVNDVKGDQEEILLKVEKRGEMLYCFRKDNDEFIGQSTNYEELAEMFKKKYPYNDGRISKEDVAETV